MSHGEAGGIRTGTAIGPRSRAAPSDTAPEAQRVLDAVHRAMSPDRKWRMIADLYRLGRRLHEAGARMRMPRATPADVRRDWAEIHLGGSARPDGGREELMSSSLESDRVVREVVDAFEALAIPYALGGSMASSLHGVFRFTTDADLTAEPFPGREAAFVGRFGDEYDVSLDAVRAAVRARSSFNVINTSVGFKVDVFLARDRPFDRSVMARRRPWDVGGPPERPVSVVSAEDIVLHKLEWYRIGGGSSDRQWSDVLGVLRVQAGRLDEAYLDRWAAELGVADLLAGARADAEAGRA